MTVKLKSVELSVESISPKKAKEYLDHANGNRPINNKHVEHLSRAISDGSWEATADTIKFNQQNQLVDGQHRLSARVRAGRTLTMVVARGITRSRLRSQDVGAKHGQS